MFHKLNQERYGDFLFIGGLGLMELLILLIPLVIWGYVVIEIVTGTFKDSIDKMVWLLVVLLVPFIGVILYYLIGRRKLAR
ncbi:PLDc N-terminal domain-containing protein [Pontibacter kalidii]|uniref:PLDc N-terminal domain-containing protein n=1 Tax=Pontibacter kalidii TaxID=2592049 RepID=UPI00224D5A5C|nr:PLDc N-terminal domain-containing protein [Pontibacter kalidii]